MPYGQKKGDNYISIDINALRTKENLNLNSLLINKHSKSNSICNFDIQIQDFDQYTQKTFNTL